MYTTQTAWERYRDISRTLQERDQCSVSETVWRRCPWTTSRTAWARRKIRASFVFFKQVSRGGRASSGKWSLRVRRQVGSTINDYKNSKIPRYIMGLPAYRHKAFLTQIFRKLLIHANSSQTAAWAQMHDEYTQA